MANTSIRSLMLSLRQKRFLNTSSSTVSPTSPSFTVQYLVNSCGLPFQSALSASTKVQLHKNNLQNLNSVLKFLKSHNFNDTHIAKLIEKRPQVLQCRVKSNLKPKFDFFIKNGFVGQLLPDVILAGPDIVRTSLDSHIKPSFERLKSFLHSDEKIVAVMKRASWLLTTNSNATVQQNLDFLVQEGVPVDRVAKLISMHPRAIVLNHDKLVYKVNSVKNLGIETKSSIFIHAVGVMIKMSESTRKKKVEVMKSLGWSEEEIWLCFKKFPYCLSGSEEKIRSTTDFLVNTVELGLQKIIIHYPVLLNYSTDKRLRPRHNVIRFLQSKKLIKEDMKIEGLLIISEKDFLQNYVTKYADKVPGLLEVYKGTTMAKKIDT